MNFKVNDIITFENGFQKSEVIKYFQDEGIKVEVIANSEDKGFFYVRENFKQTKLYLALPKDISITNHTRNKRIFNFDGFIEMMVD